jgi:hypothetical protein
LSFYFNLTSFQPGRLQAPKRMRGRLGMKLNDNEEPAMRNLIIDGAAGAETKKRHDVTFPLLTLHRGKDRVHFSTGFFQKENIYTGVLQIFRTKNR